MTMNKKEKRIAIIGILAAVGLTMGAIRASQNDIIFGGNGPIKLVAPQGVVIVKTSSSTITTNAYVPTVATVQQMINEAEPPPSPPSEVVKRYAFFILDINDGLPVEEGGTSWLGVELKASTNNYGMALTIHHEGEKQPCFWSCTELGSEHVWVDPDVRNMDGCMAYAIWQNATGTEFDNRGWLRIRNSILPYIDNVEPEKIIFPRKIGIIVAPELMKNTDGSWLKSDNDEIVWSYMRTDAVGFETNASGRAIWSMCEPACWFKSLPKWAVEGLNSGDGDSE